MKVILTTQVNLGNLWDGNSVTKEVRVETESDGLDLPWDQICAGLVKAAIIERLEAAWAEGVEGETPES
jgi:hypothetical protein